MQKPTAKTRAARQIQAQQLQINEATRLAAALIVEESWPVATAISAAAIALNLNPYQIAETEARLTGVQN